MNTEGSPSVLLIGPYDPHCGEYTFLAPPLGVWRLAGVLTAAGFEAKVFDPNCCREPPQRALERELLRGQLGRRRRFHNRDDAALRPGAGAHRAPHGARARCSSRAAWRRRSGPS